MMKVLIKFALIIFLSSSFFLNASFSLDKHHSNHISKHKTEEPKTEVGYDLHNNIVSTRPVNIDPECKLNKKVYGWHPYWYGTSYKSYDYNLLSRISYFSLKVDPKTGNFEDIHFWKTTPLIDMAKSGGTRIDLTITNFGAKNNAEFLQSKKAQSKLIKNTIKLLKLRGADGVCIDFESVPGSMRDEFSSFINKFSKEMKGKLPEATLSLALYAVDWHNVFNIKEINPAVDQFILMAYDYHTASSKKAGPVAPINSGKIWSPFNVKKSIENYLKKGVPASKLLLSVPYYGQEWKTAKSKFPSKNIDHITAKPR